MGFVSKTKFFLKWFFVFGVLSLWTLFVFSGFVATKESNLSEQEVSPDNIGGFVEEAKVSNLPLYIDDNGIIRKATTFDMLVYLFKYNFDIQESTQAIPTDTCSIRAEGGTILFNDDEITAKKNKISFFISLPNAVDSSGTLSSKKGKISSSGGNKISINFDIKEVLESSSDELNLKIGGEGKIDKQKIEGEGFLTLDKINKKISVDFFNDVNFSMNDMDVYFIKGCIDEEKEMWLLTDEGKLNEMRSIEEVRELLTQYPMIIDNFENLRRLDKKYWILLLPDGFVS